MLIFEKLVLLHCQSHTYAAKTESNSNIDVGCKLTIARTYLPIRSLLISERFSCRMTKVSDEILVVFDCKPTNTHWAGSVEDVRPDRAKRGTWRGPERSHRARYVLQNSIERR